MDFSRIFAEESFPEFYRIQKICEDGCGTDADFQAGMDRLCVRMDDLMDCLACCRGIGIDVAACEHFAAEIVEDWLEISEFRSRSRPSRFLRNSIEASAANGTHESTFNTIPTSVSQSLK